MKEETLSKAVLKIDTSPAGSVRQGGGFAQPGQTAGKPAKTKTERTKMQNQAAKRALEQGSSNAAAPEKLPDGKGDVNEITVQYNPSSIRYRASISENIPVKRENGGGGEEYQILAVTGESSVEISFSLVFHSRYSGDRSVREQMDQILEMIRKSPTRQTAFLWSGIQVEGRLVSFSGEYDMFDRTGMPVSGHMDMVIETSAKVAPTDKTLAELEKE